ncbi:MAG: HD domain-containing protein [Sphaerochaetaceae bacterium]|nr:HD domain-containing protein [Sphaerochaetaceae bacterium]
MVKNSSLILNHLVSDFTVSVRDTLWGDMLFTSEFVRLFEHPQMQKLRRIKQLGPVSLLYPGAVHTRFAHSLGVYDISRRILMSLLRNGCDTITEEGADSFLCAALLHDMGHFPYAHSLKDVVSKSHESLGVEIIRNDKDLKKLIKNTGADVDTVCSIIDPKDGTDEETELYRNLLSGALDPDKLDYLCRDACFCGVPYGVQDVSYTVSHLRVHGSRPALSADNAGSVEHLLFAKYLMYRNVYWHKTTRTATAMVKKAIISALKDGLLRESDLYFLDDSQFLSLCEKLYTEKNYKPFELVSLAESGRLYKTVRQSPCPPSITPEEIKSLEKRILTEIPAECEDWQVIVDVPEPISFESDIPLIKADGSTVTFSEESSLFGKTGVSDAFSSALRMIRVFTP